MPPGFRSAGRGPEERASFQGWGCLTAPEDEAIPGDNKYSTLLGVAEPTQHCRDERHTIAIGAVGNHVEIDPRLGIDLPAKIIQRHQKIGGEYVRLMLDLAIGGIPPNHILLPAANPVGMGEAVQKEMAELVRKGKIDPPLRADRIVVNDPPPLAPGARKSAPSKFGRSSPATVIIGSSGNLWAVYSFATIGISIGNRSAPM